MRDAQPIKSLLKEMLQGPPILAKSVLLPTEDPIDLPTIVKG